MHLVVDSIEEGVAILSGEEDYLELPAACLPDGAQEGGVLRLDIRRGDGFAELTFTIDVDAQHGDEPDLYQLGSYKPPAPDRDITH